MSTIRHINQQEAEINEALEPNLTFQKLKNTNTSEAVRIKFNFKK